jgi:hypothetical protein
VSFTPRPLYSRYPLDRTLGQSQSWSGRGGEEKSIPAPCRESNNGRPARNLVTILTELPRFFTFGRRYRNDMSMTGIPELDKYCLACRHITFKYHTRDYPKVSGLNR